LVYSNIGDKEFGLLDKEALKEIQKLESNLLTDKDYQKFCLAKQPSSADETPQCDESMVRSSLFSILGRPGTPGSLDLETTTQD
jgi:hypothetical protein